MPIEVEDVPVRSGTATEWAASGLILGEGELGVVEDTGEFRVGNGSATFANLPARSGAFKRGRATLAAGTVTVSGLDGVVAGDQVIATTHTLGTVTAPSALRAVAGTGSVTITASQNTDTSVVQYVVFKA